MDFDFSLVDNLTDEWLENWDAGIDIAYGRSLAAMGFAGDEPVYVYLTYPEFNRATFETFKADVRKHAEADAPRLTASYFSIGYSKNGFVFGVKLIKL